MSVSAPGEVAMHDQARSRLPGEPDHDRPSSALTVQDRERIRKELGLSPREFQIAICMMDGMSRQGTARLLERSPHTVDSHIRRMYVKLGVSSAAAVVGRILATYARL